MQQTFTQTITVLVGDPTGASLANTGVNSLLFISLALTLITLATGLMIYSSRRRQLRSLLSPHSWRGFGVFALLTLGAAGLAFNLPSASAAPTITVAADDTNLTISVPEGGGTADATTTLTLGTVHSAGYTLSAALAAEEPGIGISLKGGSVAALTPLKVSDTPLTLATTTTASAGDSLPLDLRFTVDGSVTEGTKELKLSFTATDNEIPAPTTMQTMTSEYCQNRMTIYDGSNDSAVLTLSDPRGATEVDYQTYEVAKLADGNCWMLENLKLGSTTTTVELTPADTTIATNFTLPQLLTTQTVDTSTNPGNNYDTPYAYGPVPGDTGEGATNYGYLYNWSAATAGETRTTMPGDGTNGDVAPHSICPLNWRLPTGGNWDSGEGEFVDLDRAFGGSGLSVWSGEPNIALWQPDGPFKGTLAGNWWSGFGVQGSWGYPWSASARPGYPDHAFRAYFSTTSVYPGGNSSRYGGGSLRCLLN